MRIKVYQSLPPGPEREIRWPGADVLGQWADLEKFGALHVSVHEETVPQAMEAYTTSSVDPASIPQRKLGRGGLVRLLIREWTSQLHQDRVNVLFGEELEFKSRVRPEMGLIASECKRAAISFDQAEFELTKESSILINRMEVTSACLESCVACFRPLGDTFLSFGVFGWRDPGSETLLAQIFRSFVHKGGFWQWDSSRLLPVVCMGSSCLFFLQ